MKTHRANNISALISRQMLGTATEDEKSRLGKWIAASQRNREIFNRITGKEGFSARLGLEDSVDIGHGLKAIRHKVRYAGSRRMYIRIASVAASLLVLIGIGVAIYDTPEPETYSMFSGENVVPGKVQAILFADGYEIVLDNSMELSIGDRTIVSDNTGNRVYSSTETAVAEKMIYIPRGGEYFLTLADGTKVWLNSGTRIIYPDRFDPQYREITIDGEAYLEVAHNPDVPFYVNVNHLKVHVTGTSFVVRNYSNEENISVALLEGGVRMESPGGSTLASLTPMMQFSMDKLTKATKTTVFDIDRVLDWKNNLFIFDNEDLGSIARRLERWYDIDIEVDPSLRMKRYYGKLNRHETMEPIISILTGTGDMEVLETEQGKIVIKPINQ
ncbi:MAG: DUF4974 domain-containing protein [Rikenellaceae bacterium]|nr:DUF4974 domain-containing protein [Rikenellaceae bacterium]MCL2693209.1 DUF4974 domain-containing protein [Rikenellaceae bacterium]